MLCTLTYQEQRWEQREARRPYWEVLDLYNHTSNLPTNARNDKWCLNLQLKNQLTLAAKMVLADVYWHNRQVWKRFQPIYRLVSYPIDLSRIETLTDDGTNQSHDSLNFSGKESRNKELRVVLCVSFPRRGYRSSGNDGMYLSAFC